MKVLAAFLLGWALLFVAFPASPRSEEVSRYFSREEVERGKLYMRGRYLLFLAGLGLKVGFLLFLILTPMSRALERFAFHLAFGRPWLAVLLYALALVLLYSLIAAPLSLYRDLLRERAFGLSTQTFQGWLVDQFKGLAVSAVLFPPLASLLYAFIRRFPHGWFLPVGLFAGLLVIVFTTLSPVLIEPIFHRFKSLEDEGLRAKVSALAERAGFRTEQILVMDASRRTKKVNAYVSGLGRTRRIVLYDTLLEGSSHEEVELVLAHELGHWKHRHLWKGIGLATLFAFVGLFIASVVLRWGVKGGLLQHPAQVSGFPLLLLALLLFSLVTLPLQSAISRHFERQADYASLLLTQNPEVFIRSEVKLARSNLADLDPPPILVFLLYTHPPVMERIGMAEAFREEGR